LFEALGMRIVDGDSAERIELVRELFVEYSESLGVDLCFQNFAEELAGLPGEYARPKGRLLLAFDELELAGCGALRAIDDAVCEMKRVYVREAFRGKGVGRTLVETLIGCATGIGYERMRLDTLPSMARAQEMYRSMGFREIAPYRANPVAGARFMELNLKG
jgi:ribosomal protein S18 acetylase RimI-like enzyme